MTQPTTAPDQSVYHRTLHQVSFGLKHIPSPQVMASIPTDLASYRLVKAEFKSDGEVTLVGGKHALISVVNLLSDTDLITYTTARSVLDMLLDIAD